MKYMFYIVLAFFSIKLQAQTNTQERGYYLPAKITAVLYDEATIAEPGIAEFLAAAMNVASEWYPVIDKYLESEGHIPTGDITLRAQSTGPIGWASGTTIGFNIDWIKPGARGEKDWGMVVHEVVHFIQGYRRGPGTGVPFWVMEGIADYVRHALFEPEAEMRPVNPETASYTQAYQISAGFLMWIADTYDLDIVPKLNVHGRQRTYSDDVFVEYTGKNYDALWAEYVEKILRPLHAEDKRMVPATMFPNLMQHLEEFYQRIAKLEAEPRPQQEEE
jgi:RNAse (barnase) inhibitor barstar